MITKITMSNVASYRLPAALETDKKINLLYGLNGTGKTVLSSYLYDRSNPAYSDCRIEGLQDARVLVYNEKFVFDNFYEADNLRGIFTLSKGNKAAEEAVKKSMLALNNIEEALQKSQVEKSANEVRRVKLFADAANDAWRIKTTYSGGDRVLEFCLDGLKSKKEVLFNRLQSEPKPDVSPLATIDSLRREVELLESQGHQEIAQLPLVVFHGQAIELAEIWGSVLVGNENSAVAGLIERLSNSDWVKKGITYLESSFDNSPSVCPFCQQTTITLDIRNEIRNYFDENYEKSLQSIVQHQASYEHITHSLPSITDFQHNPFAVEQRAEIELALNNLLGQVEKNKFVIAEKVRQPSQRVSLVSTSDSLAALNGILMGVNEKIQVQNEKVKKKGETFSRINDTFWKIMRLEYDRMISNFHGALSQIVRQNQELDNLIADDLEMARKYREEVANHQKSTVNVDEAVHNINNGLLELGIDSFSIVKHHEKFYRIARSGSLDRTFKTLSEGEKMIISFLYFRELCRGWSDVQDATAKKIVVIDDPISSLSHIYVFNVGRLIKNTFLRAGDYDQIFVLTHSLYFFYEIVETHHERRKEDHKLFRLSKNINGSAFSEMRYEEIQSDYQAYWYIIRDLDQPAALIANSMRNVLEYFFNFIEKRDLNNLFAKPELSAVRFQAFNRFINRESHSLGQNIFDYKEFNYNDFRDAFEAIFQAAGYRDHYLKMIRK